MSVFELNASLFISKDKIERMTQELITFDSMISSDNIRLKNSVTDKTRFVINPDTLDPREVGTKKANELTQWWNDYNTKIEIKSILTKPKKVDGNPNNWSVGCFGSRWCDVVINKRLTRVGFHSRTFDEFPHSADPTKNYLVTFDASASHIMTDDEIKKYKKSKKCYECGAIGKMKTSECCGKNYCDSECYEKDKEDHLKRWEKAKEHNSNYHLNRD